MAVIIAHPADVQRDIRDRRLLVPGDHFSNSLLRKQPRRSSARYPPPSTRHTFETDEYSMLPRGYAINQGQQGVVENEAPLERLRRLRFEVDQLEEELEHKQVPASSSRATASSPTARECPISYHAHTK
ncbi:hypothetical protein MJO28_001803 [Puccinia striiformis f. sp. tritici]|uniref:Uncharacterized protein n=3 Tax=Puccinia striiformis TaxID=27350 RepID=A0A0L0W4I5_9BASI|nr:hypothetical protein MJO28_001803 [Puccinia striiformis f. sp. tritici]KAI9620521.1 hypothetical protein H4Q26_013734 [Puccinia striiformis f. sp. tritici PST-130]KNF06367.1 hypothetical protein PSTG_00250 [Puccinia striiformis f. sp. tritici PST-78]POV94144.1 hypothetical protein PSTT_16997 [Puccinia striiformis]KAI7966101.1 hypothetical protein MJO29_001849 [Puccinia striiformis f. sp. tritici]